MKALTSTFRSLSLRRLHRFFNPEQAADGPLRSHFLNMLVWDPLWLRIK
jgi:hypothetical protein